MIKFILQRVVCFYKGKWFRAIVEKRLTWGMDGNILVHFCDFGVSHNLKVSIFSLN